MHWFQACTSVCLSLLAHIIIQEEGEKEEEEEEEEEENKEKEEEAFSVSSVDGR